MRMIKTNWGRIYIGRYVEFSIKKLGTFKCVCIPLCFWPTWTAFDWYFLFHFINHVFLEKQSHSKEIMILIDIIHASKSITSKLLMQHTIDSIYLFIYAAHCKHIIYLHLLFFCKLSQAPETKEVMFNVTFSSNCFAIYSIKKHNK